MSGPGNVEATETTTPHLANRVVRGGMWVALSSYWTIGFGFVANIFLTRMLDPDDLGTYAYALFFVQLLQLQPKLGIKYGFVQLKQVGDEAVGTYFVLESLTALIVVLVTLVAYPLLPSSIALIVLVMSCLLGIQGIGQVGSVLLDRELKFGLTSRVDILAFTFSYVPAFWLAAEGFGVWSLVAQNLVYGALSILAFVWIFRGRLPSIWRARKQFSFLLTRRYLGFGLTVGLALFAGGLVASLGNFLIATFVDTTVLGFYDRAYRMAQWPGLLFNGVLSRTVFYTYARLQSDPARLGRATEMVLWLVTMVAFPLASILAIASPDIIALLYGDRWLAAGTFLRVLSIVFAVRPLIENAGTLLTAIGKPKLNTKVVVVQLVVIAVAGVPLTFLWGGMGVCLASMLASLCGIVLMYRYVLREVAVKLMPTLGSSFLVWSLTVLGYLAITRVIPLEQLAPLFRVALLSSYVLCAFCLLAFVVQPRMFLVRVRYVWNLIGSK